MRPRKLPQPTTTIDPAATITPQPAAKLIVEIPHFKPLEDIPTFDKGEKREILEIKEAGEAAAEGANISFESQVSLSLIRKNIGGRSSIYTHAYYARTHSRPNTITFDFYPNSKNNNSLKSSLPNLQEINI